MMLRQMNSNFLPCSKRNYWYGLQFIGFLRRAQVWRAQARRLLGLVVLHAAQDVVERAHCRDDVRSFVQHHALRTFSHRRVGDLGARWLPFFGERLEDLRCPDYRQMRRLADPENFLLNFRHPFVTALDCQISSRDHDTHRMLPHRSEHEAGQSLKTLARLDFQHDSQVIATKLPQSRLKLKDVALMADERHPDQVRVSNDELKVFEIFRRKSRQVDTGIGQINSLVGSEAASARPGLGDFDAKRVGPDPSHDSAYLAVVEPDFLARANPRENLRQRA